MTEVCPHCGSKQTFTFKSDIYIVQGKDFIKKPFYGCMDCKSAFVIIENEINKEVKSTGSTNVQNALGRVSKNIFNVLGNIK